MRNYCPINLSIEREAEVPAAPKMPRSCKPLYCVARDLMIPIEISPRYIALPREFLTKARRYRTFAPPNFNQLNLRALGRDDFRTVCLSHKFLEQAQTSIWSTHLATLHSAHSLKSPQVANPQAAISLSSRGRAITRNLRRQLS